MGVPEKVAVSYLQLYEGDAFVSKLRHIERKNSYTYIHVIRV